MVTFQTIKKSSWNKIEKDHAKTLFYIQQGWKHNIFKKNRLLKSKGSIRDPGRRVSSPRKEFEKIKWKTQKV